ncbi:hypothetical protein AB0N17_46025, partial [Streptomyces sp. NPDC051133]|uniref:hypothetical protein n=1 Tax=Streptomyces sp. NPDC051133 TaxID=3155521 RepID=UPI0034172BC6
MLEFWGGWLQDIGAGPLGSTGRSREGRAKAVELALIALRENGGYRRGMAARLARQHGGVERSWQRAVNEARTLFSGNVACSVPRRRVSSDRDEDLGPVIPRLLPRPDPQPLLLRFSVSGFEGEGWLFPPARSA